MVFLNIFLSFGRVFGGVFLGFKVKFYNIGVLISLSRGISRGTGYNNRNRRLKNKTGLKKSRLKIY